MILLLGVLAGWLTGLIRAFLKDQPYRTPELSRVWLVVAAVLPQLVVFQIPATANWFPDQAAAGVLVLSLVVLLVFVWFNRDRDGVVIIGLGLILNLLVITLNGGLMPLAPETAQSLYPDLPASVWEVGSRPGRSKNIILPETETVLADLSDSLLLPAWFPWTRAMSPGDLLIVLGVFWLLAYEGLETPAHTERLPAAGELRELN